MKLFNIILTILLLAVSASAGVADGKAYPIFKNDYWLGVYYNKVKVGCMHITTDTDDLVAGVPLYERSITACSRLTIWKKDIHFESQYKCYINGTYSSSLETYKLIDATENKVMVTRETNYGSKYTDTTVTINGKVERTKELFTDKKAVISGNAYDLGANMLKVGDKLELCHFGCRYIIETDTTKVSIGTSIRTVNVLKREKLKVNGIEYDTVVVSDKENEATSTEWRLDNGEIVKIDMPEDHIMMIREPKELATELESKAGPDITQLLK